MKNWFTSLQCYQFNCAKCSGNSVWKLSSWIFARYQLVICLACFVNALSRNCQILYIDAVNCHWWCSGWKTFSISICSYVKVNVTFYLLPYIQGMNLSRRILLFLVQINGHLGSTRSNCENLVNTKSREGKLLRDKSHMWCIGVPPHWVEETCCFPSSFWGRQR